MFLLVTLSKYTAKLASTHYSAYFCILWHEEVCVALKTITYGLACASFQVLCIMNHIIFLSLQNNIFIDDLVAGADSTVGLLRLKEEISLSCSGGGFTMKKWCSSHLEILSVDPLEQQCCCCKPHPGVKLDCGFFFVQFSSWFWAYSPEWFTKLLVLSSMAQLFDTCRWLSLAIFKGK